MDLSSIQTRLKTYNLRKSLEEKWLNNIMPEFVTLEPTQNTYLDEDDINGLLKEGKYTEVACSLLSQGEINELSPLQYAITSGNTLLLIVLLANGLDVSERSNSDDAHLALAVANNKAEIFNLLLLVDKINVNDIYFSENDLSDIAAYFGRYNHGNHFTALTWLQKPEYHHIHDFLNIDWDLCWGEHNNPLIFYAYLDNDFKMMDRLVSLGANMNPVINYKHYESLIHLAVESWTKDKPATHKGLEWFSKYCSFLSDEYQGNHNLITAIFSNESPIQFNHLGLTGLDLIEDSINEYTDEIEELKNKINNQNSILHPYYHPVDERRVTSLFHDLHGNGRIIFSDEVQDFLMSTPEYDIIELAIIKGESNFPIKFSVNASLLDKVISSLYIQDDIITLTHLYGLSDYQRIHFFLHCPIEFLIAINILANANDIHILEEAKDTPIINYNDFECMLAFYESTSHSMHPFLRNALHDALTKYQSIYNKLLAYGVIDIDVNRGLISEEIKCFSKPLIGEYEITFDGESISIDMCIEDDKIKEVIKHSSWIKFIKKTNLFKQCPGCHKLFYRPVMAYDEACEECI